MATLRALLAATGWLERTRDFARGLRRYTRSPGGLLLVGTPDEEPWHLTAHLDEESRLAGIPELMPTLVRWQVPNGAPAHLRVGLDRLEAARRGETLFVVTPSTAPVPLLERVDDARKSGATIFALDQGDSELDSLAHETLTIRPRFDPVSFGAVQHLVSSACGELVPAGGSGGRANAAGGSGGRGGVVPPGANAAGREFGVGVTGGAPADSQAEIPGNGKGRGGVRGLRDRVARLLDAVSGPNP